MGCNRITHSPLIEPTVASLALSSKISAHISHIRVLRRLNIGFPELRLSIEPGFGFIRTVWLMVAQAASQIRSVYVAPPAGCPTFALTECVLQDEPIQLLRRLRHERSRRKEDLSSRKARSRLRELVSFVGQQANTDRLDWNDILAKWNELYPQWNYRGTEDLLNDLKFKTKTYGVNCESLAAVLEVSK